MSETFEERLKIEVTNILIEHKYNEILRQLREYDIYFMKKYLKLFGDVLSMEFLPKKVILNPKTKKAKVVFLNKYIQVKKIEYKPDIIYDGFKKLGVDLPFCIIKKYAMSKDKQKKRDNKYLNLDLKR